MKSLRRLNLNSKSDNNLRGKIDRTNMSAQMKSLLTSLEPASTALNSEANRSQPTDLDRDSNSHEVGVEEDVENTNLADSLKGAESLKARSVASKDECVVRVPSGGDENTDIQAIDETETGLSFFRPPEELDDTVNSPEAARRAQCIVAESMAKFEKESIPMDTSTVAEPETAKDRSPSLTGDSIGQSVFITQHSASPPAESAAIESSGPKEVVTSMAFVEDKEPECPFQKQLVLQEQQQQQQQGGVEEGIHPQSQVNAGFKPRRKRISSSGGKRLPLKKKLSHSNLHGNFQQQKGAQSMQQGSEGNSLDSSSLSSTPNAVPTVQSEQVIPQFYFPLGKPMAASKRRQRVQSVIIFVVAENGALSESSFVAITAQCCELPRYLNRALFRKIGDVGSGEVRFSEFERAWESLVEACPDEISMIFMILKQPGANVLTPTDFEVVLQDLILFHPGLEFLSGNSVFQERYLETVITRIFYEANRRHGKMTLSDLRRSNFDKTLRKLENSDLNQTEDCFSYKHFYVIYCKFWELDQDHDLILDEQDLAGYSGGAISTKVIRRVMQGYGNETGMFMVPDQELVLHQHHLQQQQQIQFMQQQQQLQLQQQQQQRQQLEQQSQIEQVQETLQPEQSVQQSDVQIAEPVLESELTQNSDIVGLDKEGSPILPNTLRRSQTMTLSSVNLALEPPVAAADNITGDDVTDMNTNSVSISSTDGMIQMEMAPTAVTATFQSPLRTIPPGPGTQCRPQNYRMTYKGFIWFLLAETDKQTTTSIEYWFRCMDLDGDGLLTVFELEQLFQEQATRMAFLGMESFGFRDAICQMQDLVSPKETGIVRLSDLKQCGQAGPFIDLFCNVVRWRSFEAHQHQIRMRQQQIAMQRAADAAWEEAATGEELFDGVGDDECDDGGEETSEDEDEGESDDSYDDDANEDEVEWGFEGQLADKSRLQKDEDFLAVKDASISLFQGKTDLLGAQCVDLGLKIGVSSRDEMSNDQVSVQHQYQSLDRHSDSGSTMASVESHGGDGAGLDIIETVTTAAETVDKTRKRARTKERRRKRRQSMMRRVHLEEQRKEKALLATIRESPWIVYVESEYEKLVTIERPQSRTGWDQEEEDDDEEEEEGMEEEEEEVMDEDDMMMEEGSAAAVNELLVMMDHSSSSTGLAITRATTGTIADENYELEQIAMDSYTL
ncbi:Serine/threonine-protein phosphatase 2A regulatory subunit B'' subunit alpha [Haplosporangium sp. Z 11]|nr:Serine/threonine-protein phosphatase 2A regulatory subunit B'' subunit alpha [Haplosporangium sp. Z 11]